MEDLSLQIALLPAEVKRAWSVGFVFVKEDNHYWHFPARQWTEQQIQDYFWERYGQSSHFLIYPEMKLKQLIVEDKPSLLVIVPYIPGKETN